MTGSSSPPSSVGAAIRAGNPDPQLVGFNNANQGLQVLGGAGFTTDWPLEQLVRDGRIARIYEGTNGIQAMDLVGRKIRMADGAAF